MENLFVYFEGDDENSGEQHYIFLLISYIYIFSFLSITFLLVLIVFCQQGKIQNSKTSHEKVDPDKTHSIEIVNMAQEVINMDHESNNESPVRPLSQQSIQN